MEKTEKPVVQPEKTPRKPLPLSGFVVFIREQGVVGLAVGFILGGSISKVVTSIVNDLINPIVGIFLGAAGDLKDYYLQIGQSKIMYGNFFATAIDFLMIALVVYLGVNILRLDRIDKKKEPKK
jgi:large conductance mechanosensitive channel